MRHSLNAAALAAAFLASACATSPATTPEGTPVHTVPAAGALGSELYGEGVTVRVDLSGREYNTLTFHNDGTVSNLIHSSGQVARGRWWLADQQLCLNWDGTSRPECWPYPTALQPGQAVSLTSDRGNRVTVTMLRGST
jgi:hypothetical protein